MRLRKKRQLDPQMVWAPNRAIIFASVKPLVAIGESGLGSSMVALALGARESLRPSRRFQLGLLTATTPSLAATVRVSVQDTMLGKTCSNSDFAASTTWKPRREFLFRGGGGAILSFHGRGVVQEDKAIIALLEAVVEVHLEEGGPESRLPGDGPLDHCADDGGGPGASGVVEG
ncbi:hypothetical protein ACFX2J_032854 [Malus domestica]